MKTFHCSQCGIMVFFENDRCVKCDHPLGFRPDSLELVALEDAGNETFRVAGAKEGGKRYRQCANGRQHGACNWLVPADGPDAWCVACRLNEIIPDLSDRRNLIRWAKLELAKRRCVYTLLSLGLPLEGAKGAEGTKLRFRFLQEQPNAPVLTGHENGVITVNIAEADDDERERRRLNLHEPYRTLVGHFRHECGHFYWDRLIADSTNLSRFRELFGDETVSYDEALKTYYQQGAPTDWASRMVTPYASSHPWEDWAETWAHYLHMVDTLESAAGFGLSVSDPTSEVAEQKSVRKLIRYSNGTDFDEMLAEWTPLICALNAINRSMGLADLYPFVISAPVVEKLRFIHQVIRGRH